MTERGMHVAVLRYLANVGEVDMRRISEPFRQRLIDLAMREPPLVDAAADRAFLTDAGRLAVADGECACIDCDGSGRYPSGAPCKSCGGSGRVNPGDGVALPPAAHT